MFATRARTHRAYIPLALTAVLSVMTAAVAQQATDDQAPSSKAKPAKQKSAAPKTSDKKCEPKSEAKSAPARKGNGGPATTSAVPAPGGGQPTLLGQYGEWGAYTANAGGRTLCYALAKPSSQATQ